MDGDREYHSKGGRKPGTGGITMLGESPCDKCLRGEKYCSRNGLACEDYLHYIKKGEVRLRDRAPSADCYMRIQASGSQEKDCKKESSSQEACRQEEGATAQKGSLTQKSATAQKAGSRQKEIPRKKKYEEKISAIKTRKAAGRHKLPEGRIGSLCQV